MRYSCDIGLIEEENLRFLYQMGIINKQRGIRGEKIGDIHLWSIYRAVFDEYRDNKQRSVNNVIWRMRKDCMGNPRDWLLSRRSVKKKSGVTDAVTEAFKDI